MNLRYVKIDKGGNVTMKDETKKSMYTKEEEKLGAELCDTINADQELKQFFKTTCFGILKAYAGDINRAFDARDEKKGTEVMQETIDLMRALTMHVYIKVMVKKKEAK